jgi:hypothetical protein
LPADRSRARESHRGEFVRLFRLLGAVIQPFTPAALGSVRELLDRGKQRAHELQIEDPDDVVCVTLAMFDDYADEFEQLVREQRGPATTSQAIFGHPVNGTAAGSSPADLMASRAGLST